MTLVVSGIWRDADLSKMKLLVLALCVCAASAASTFSRPSTLPKATVAKPLQKLPTSKPASASLRLKAPAPAPTPAPTPAPSPAPTTAQPEPPKPSYQPAPLAAKRLPEPSRLSTSSYQSDSEAKVIHSELENDQNGFKYSYETGNGISGESTGTLKTENNVDFVVIQGRYQYPGPDGPIEVSFTADEDGFHPQSNILPTSPPVPPYVLRLVQYLEEHAIPQQ